MFLVCNRITVGLVLIGGRDVLDEFTWVGHKGGMVVFVVSSSWDKTVRAWDIFSRRSVSKKTLTHSYDLVQV